VYRRQNLAAVLAFVLLAGPWTPAEVERRAVEAFGSRSHKRARRLVEDILARAPVPYAPRWVQLVRLIESSKVMRRVGPSAAARLAELAVTVAPPSFQPVAALERLRVPVLRTPRAIADWLAIPLDQLDWLADERRTLRLEGERSRLQHYERSWIPKPCGRWRLIEAPKPRLKEIQRRILHEILDLLPVHDAAFAFVKGRNAAEAAAKHAGEHVVLTIDLKDFFLHVRQARIHGLFRCLGYTTRIARLLTSLCTTITPRDTLGRYPGKLRNDETAWNTYRMPHLPQGAPTSPALANLASYRLDLRLTGLANAFGARYTRYADDLTFSGDRAFAKRTATFLRALAVIAREEGFSINHAKSRLMPQHVCQSVTGLVVNQHINIRRKDYDRLKATLTNCVRNGPPTQNRDGHADFRAHLDGRVAWVERVNLRRGEKLRRLFDAIAW
jgi:hypothetical protein